MLVGPIFNTFTVLMLFSQVSITCVYFLLCAKFSVPNIVDTNPDQYLPFWQVRLTVPLRHYGHVY